MGECTPALFISASYALTPFVPTPNTKTEKDDIPILPQMNPAIAGFVMTGMFIILIAISTLYSYSRYLKNLKNRGSLIPDDSILNGNYIDTD